MRAAILFAVLVFLATPVIAQQPLKSEIKLTPITSGGHTIGCSLEYTMIIADRVYRSGGMVGLIGAYAWMAGRDVPGIAGMFKLGAVDFDQNMRPTRFKPATTALRIGGKPFLPQAPMPCEEDHNVCGAYSTDGSLAVLTAMWDGPIEIGFNRRRGSFDVLVPFDVPNKEMLKLGACIKELAGGFRTQPKKR
jgi:hypothetical protein